MTDRVPIEEAWLTEVTKKFPRLYWWFWVTLT